MLTSSFHSRLRRFAQDTQGTVTVEVVIMLPVLLLLFSASWVLFDAFRQHAINQKANYAIGDMISRETDEIDDTYVDNTYRLLGMLTHNDWEADEETGSMPYGLRISVVSYDAQDEAYELEWSEARGDETLPLTAADMTGLEEKLPPATSLTQMIIVETWEDYHPVLDVGLVDSVINTYSFLPPRYTGQLLYAAADSGGSGSGGTSCTNSGCTNEDGSNNVEPNSGYGGYGGYH